MAKETIREKIISFLQKKPDGIDDDLLMAELRLKTRQQASYHCRKLVSDGLVVRRKVNSKIHNFWVEKKEKVNGLEKPEPEAKLQPPHPDNLKGLTQKDLWFVKNSIQSKVIDFLVSKSFFIHSVADTDIHQSNIDIIAESDFKLLCVSVKGYPESSSLTFSHDQAKDWFRQAVFDMVNFRERDKKYMIAIALPDFPYYRDLSNQISWLKKAAKFNYIWVKVDGSVVVE